MSIIYLAARLFRTKELGSVNKKVCKKALHSSKFRLNFQRFFCFFFLVMSWYCEKYPKIVLIYELKILPLDETLLKLYGRPVLTSLWYLTENFWRGAIHKLRRQLRGKGDSPNLYACLWWGRGSHRLVYVGKHGL